MGNEKGSGAARKFSVAFLLPRAGLFCNRLGERGVARRHVEEVVVFVDSFDAVLGAVGDLAESLIKRAVEAKDSGRGLPGLGGLLDMFDSLLYTAPVLFFYVKAFGG
mgnify:CR=1 FL=1